MDVDPARLARRRRPLQGRQVPPAARALPQVLRSPVRLFVTTFDKKNASKPLKISW